MVAILFAILFAIATAYIGSEKGYSGFLCGVAGLFGGFIALIIVLILPNKTEEQEQRDAAARYEANQRAAAAQREAAQRDEIAALRQRIADLENARPATSDAEPDDT